MNDEEFLQSQGVRHWFVRTSEGWRLVIDGLPKGCWHFFGNTKQAALADAHETLAPYFVRLRFVRD